MWASATAGEGVDIGVQPAGTMDNLEARHIRKEGNAGLLDLGSLFQWD